MSPQMFFAFSYTSFLIFDRISCLYEGKTERTLKILSAISLILATFFILNFFKKIVLKNIFGSGPVLELRN